MTFEDPTEALWDDMHPDTLSAETPRPVCPDCPNCTEPTRCACWCHAEQDWQLLETETPT